MVNITINEKNFEVPEGTTVLRAAEQNGIKIPKLCDHPELTPYGGCRLCLVEVEGARTLQPSCTLPVSNNMVVHTDTDRVKEARKFVLTLIFSERNHFCPFCQVSGGDCELQNAAYAEGMTNWPLPPNWQSYQVDASHPYFILDNNRCILCRRCVRACGELIGNFTLGIEERGANSFLIADYGVPLGESTCVSCGSCVQVCPTGAIIDRQSAYQGRETQVERTRTVCNGCSVGCGMEVLTRDNRLVRIDGDWDAAINAGILCKVGRFLPQDETRQRIVTPLVRKNGSLKAATWDEALTLAAGKLKEIKGKSDGLAALASGRLTAEALHQFKQLFADGLGSSVVTTLDEDALAAAAKFAEAGKKPFEGELAALDMADCVVVAGADLLKDHEVVSFFVKRGLPQGLSLVVIDPETNGLDGLANQSLKPKKNGLVDTVQSLSNALREKATEKTLAPAAEKTGVPAAALLETAHLIAAAKKPVFIYNKSLSAEALKALVELAGACKDAVVLGLKGSANSLTAAQYGLDHALDVKNRSAAFVALADDTPTQRLTQELGAVPFKVVLASYVSPLTAAADVVLPVEMWAEQEGHFLSMDGHLQAAHSSLKAPEEVRASEAVLKDLANQLGVKTNDQWKKQLSQRVSSAAVVES